MEKNSTQQGGPTAAFVHAFVKQCRLASTSRLMTRWRRLFLPVIPQRFHRPGSASPTGHGKMTSGFDVAW